MGQDLWGNIMPYEWVASAQDSTELHLWPYRSLRRRGMVVFVALTAALLALPLLVLIGSPVLWGLLPFVLGALAAIWLALQRSYKDAEIIEILRLSASEMQLTRHGPRGRRQEWQANPHWVQVQIHATGGPVPHYLTLRGAGREVELGAFLTEGERLTLERDLRRALRGSQ
jgi:uncharacterized membrane protein